MRSTDTEYHSFDAFRLRKQVIGWDDDPDPDAVPNEDGSNIFGPPQEFTVQDKETWIYPAFVKLLQAYGATQKHFEIGNAMLLAEAFGMEVEGRYAVSLAKDPNLIVWSLSSKLFLVNLIEAVTQDPDQTELHLIGPDAAKGEAFTPPFNLLDIDLYLKNEPQPRPCWIPMIICCQLKGLRAKAMAEQPSLGDLLGQLVEKMKEVTGQKSLGSFSA